MKLFNKINVNDVVQKTIGGIDKMALTKQEKAEHMVKIADAQADFVKSTLNANTVSSKARRYIAILLISLFVLMIVAAVILYKIDPDYSKFIFEVIKSELSVLILMVMGFYFGGYMYSNHLSRGIMKTRDERKEERRQTKGKNKEK